MLSCKRLKQDISHAITLVQDPAIHQSLETLSINENKNITIVRIKARDNSDR